MLSGPTFDDTFNITVSSPTLFTFFIKTVEKVYKISNNSGKKYIYSVKKCIHNLQMVT